MPSRLQELLTSVSYQAVRALPPGNLRYIFGIKPLGQALGTIYPNNSTLDLLVGGTTTASAKFAVLNINSGTPTASVSANSGNNAIYLTGDGTLATTNRQTLTIGNSAAYNTTGNVLINPNGTGNVGIGTTDPVTKLQINSQASTALADPLAVSLGATYGTGTLGKNLKLKLYDDTISANSYGVGISASLFEITTGTGADFAFCKCCYSYGTSENKSGGNVGIGTTTPNSLLQVAGTASVAGAFTIYTTPTIQSTNNQTLTIGGNTTGNIIINPLNAQAGGYVRPNTDNVTDLGLSNFNFRNVFATTYNSGTNIGQSLTNSACVNTIGEL